MNTIYTGMVLIFIPGIVTALTGVVKLAPTFAYLSDETRTPAVRTIAAVISLLVVLVSQWVSGSFDAGILAASVQTVLFTAGTWFASLGIFHGVFQK